MKNQNKKRHFSTVIIVLFFVVGFLFGDGSGVAMESASLSSPDGRTVLRVFEGNPPTFELTFGGQPVLTRSPLGLAFRDAKPFESMTIEKTNLVVVDSTWENRFGRNRTMIDRANELTVVFRETAEKGRSLGVVFRVYNEGAAFRYQISGDSFSDDTPKNAGFVLTEEKTAFRFPNDFDCWATDNKTVNSSHENEFFVKKLSDIGPKAVVGLPLVVRVDGVGYAALAEAALSRWSACHYFGAVKKEDSSVEIRLGLTPRRDGVGLVTGTLPTASPWRVILLGEKAVDLVNNSGLILNLNPPCALAETDWIKPGVSGWDWWTARNSDLSTDSFRDKVAFAAEMGWAYTTLDAPWYGSHHLRPSKEGKPVDILSGNDRFNLDEGLTAAKEKGIGVFVWVHVDDLIACGVEKAFDFYAKRGIVGLKIDFIDHDDQEMVEWVEETLRLAAKKRLMINFHGMFRPTGINRTWPNFITQEGILGNEFNKFNGRITALHTATLPFTRFLIGPGDFTPGGFLNVRPENFSEQKGGITPPCQEMGTRAHSLALCLLYDSPLMTLCDHPDHYRNQPGIDWLRNLPSVWDESRAISGEIGESLVEIRRSGDRWFAAAIAGEKPVETGLTLDFLGDGVWKATVYADTPESDRDPTQIDQTEKEVRPGDRLPIVMTSGGGWNAVFSR